MVPPSSESLYSMKLVKTTKIASDSFTASKTRDPPKAAAPLVATPSARKARKITVPETAAALTEPGLNVQQ